LREKGETIRIEHLLALIARLKQICNFDPDTGESAKVVAMRDRLAALSEQGHRTLLFMRISITLELTLVIPILGKLL